MSYYAQRMAEVFPVKAWLSKHEKRVMEKYMLRKVYHGNQGQIGF